jgi:hypothetical protein
MLKSWKFAIDCSFETGSVLGVGRMIIQRAKTFKEIFGGWVNTNLLELLEL